MVIAADRVNVVLKLCWLALVSISVQILWNDANPLLRSLRQSAILRCRSRSSESMESLRVRRPGFRY